MLAVRMYDGTGGGGLHRGDTAARRLDEVRAMIEATTVRSPYPWP